MIPFKDNVPLTRTPVITITLVGANVAAYLLAALHGGSLIGGPSSQTVVRYGAIPYEFSHWGQHCALGLVIFKQALLCAGEHHVTGTAGPQPATWETAFTGMFLHANLLHLAVNMTFLGVFGATVEEHVGRVTFLGLYLLGGLVALVCQLLVAPGSTTPTLGGSGALAAVLGAYIVLHPNAKLRTLVPATLHLTLVELPAWAVVTAWFALDATLGALGLSTPLAARASTAYYAHWGGFAPGVLLALTIIGSQHSGGRTPGSSSADRRSDNGPASETPCRASSRERLSAFLTTPRGLCLRFRSSCQAVRYITSLRHLLIVVACFDLRGVARGTGVRAYLGPPLSGESFAQCE